jgi:hypothetical protein
MTAIIDKNMLKQALREFIHEEPIVFKTLLKEILVEEQNQTSDKEFEMLINKNFERFGDTFRALA